MKIALIAIGKLKDGAELTLYQRYAARFDAMARLTALGPLNLVEIAESRAGAAIERKRAEADQILRRIPAGFQIAALDESGEMRDSAGFAASLRLWRDDGAPGVAFLTGGPDGHGAAVLKSAGTILSFGRISLPHGLARIVLAEQLYRSATIIAGHPYHRE